MRRESQETWERRPCETEDHLRQETMRQEKGYRRPLDRRPWDRRHETEDTMETLCRRHETLDRRCETWDKRQEKGVVRQEPWGRRRDTEDLRQEMSSRRPETGELDSWLERHQCRESELAPLSDGRVNHYCDSDRGSVCVIQRTNPLSSPMSWSTRLSQGPTYTRIYRCTYVHRRPGRDGRRG